MSLEIYGDGTIKRNGNTAVTIDSTPQATFTNSVSQPGAFMFRNKIINGNFDIWQRGTSQTSSGYGSADRWRNVNIGSTKTASRQAFALGQTDVPGNPRYFLRHVVTSVAGAANYVISAQYIEGVETLSGKTAKLSFWAKADASKNIAIEFIQSFGSGGSPSTSVFGIGSQLVALTTSWAKYTVTVEVPSVSGKTLGTDGNDYLSLFFWFDTGSNFNTRAANLGQQSGTFDLAQIQLEEGAVATPFEQRVIGMELSLCERYYQITPLNAFDTGITSYSSPFYLTPMRTAPTGTISGGSNEFVSSRLVENITNKGGRFTILGTAVGSYSAAASGLFDAELS